MIKKMDQATKREKQPNKRMFSHILIPAYSHPYGKITNLTFPQTSKVRKICKYAFSGCCMLNSVTINGTVEEIGEGCFIDCIKLYKFLISGDSHLKIIGSHAFEGTSICSFNFPPSLKKIGERAFYLSGFKKINLSRTQLEIFENNSFLLHNNKILFPNTVKKISIYSGRIRIKVEEGGKFIRSDGSLTYSIPNKEIISSSKKMKHATIRRGIERIGQNSFFESVIKYVSIPSSVIDIGNSAFQLCENLVRIKFKTPSSLQSIGESAFESCERLKRINLPNSLIKIGKNAFTCCHKLEKMFIPSSVIELGKFSFYRCDSLIEVSFASDSQLEIIGKNCFLGTKIRNFTIPSKVREIRGNIFGFNGIESLKIDSPHFHIENGILINNTNEVVAFLEEKDGEIKIPHGIKAILNNASSGLMHQPKMYLPSTIERLEHRCFCKFYGNGLIFPEDSIIKEIPEKFMNLNSLTLPSSVEKIPLNTFANNSSLNLIINNSFFTTDENGIVYSHSPKGIVHCGTKQFGSFDFTGIEVIYGGAFFLFKMNNIVFDKTLRIVGKNAFLAPEKLKFHPDSHIEKICESAFSHIGGKKRKYMDSVIELPRLVDEIENKSFSSKELVLPNDFEFKFIGNEINSNGIMIPKSLIPKIKYFVHKNVKIIDQ